MYTGAEAREAYIQLQTVLLQSELSWIVPQIQEEVARGKITSKSIKDLGESQTLGLFESYEQYGFKKSSKEQVLTSQAYNEVEQLTILLNALLEVAEINVIRKQIMANFQELDSTISSIQFVSEESDNASILMDDGSQSRMDGYFDSLSKIMNELKSNL